MSCVSRQIHTRQRCCAVCTTFHWHCRYKNASGRRSSLQYRTAARNAELMCSGLRRHGEFQSVVLWPLARYAFHSPAWVFLSLSLSLSLGVSLVSIRNQRNAGRRPRPLSSSVSASPSSTAHGRSPDLSDVGSWGLPGWGGGSVTVAWGEDPTPLIKHTLYFVLQYGE